MAITNNEYVDVVERARSLGCNVPEALAVLPRNFDSATSSDELEHESSAVTVRTLWRTAAIRETPIEPEGVDFRRVEEFSADWVGPIVFIAAAAWTQDPGLVNAALEAIAGYVAELFKGKPSATVRLSVVVEQSAGSRSRRIQYDGNVDGLQQLPDVVREAVKHE